jgi:hypothetical protein
MDHKRMNGTQELPPKNRPNNGQGEPMTEDREKQIQELQEELDWVMNAVEPVTTLGLRLRLIERLGAQLDELRKELK